MLINKTEKEVLKGFKYYKGIVGEYYYLTDEYLQVILTEYEYNLYQHQFTLLEEDEYVEGELTETKVTYNVRITEEFNLNHNLKDIYKVLESINLYDEAKDGVIQQYTNLLLKVGQELDKKMREYENIEN